jgi:basic membrane lipoprotein Med (substrate-binding protein (PBP1-ABC) superfamily)/DNA-binding SARP family transcriptional activator
LLRADEVVRVERIVEDVWGDKPPASAGHSLEAYVSRLRQAISQYGPSLERRGNGYRLRLGDASLDSQVFEQLLEEASRAAASRRHARAAELAQGALLLWRGPVLADVQLHAAGRAEAERLEELRLRAIEVRVDAELALGRHAQVVGELQLLVDAYPYRERFIAQLMSAFYRSGRQVEALEIYEATRRALAADLGLQPSAELQRLSGQLIRQEPQLAAPAPVALSRSVRLVSTSRRARVGALVLALLAVVAGAAAVAWVMGAAGTSRVTAAPRVALILPREQKAGREDTFVNPLVDGLRRAEREYGVETKTLVVDQMDPDAESVKRIAGELRTGDFDLVLWAGWGPAQWKLLPEVRRLPDTWFVYIDASLAGSPLEGSQNATALSFDDEQAGYLVGYLSALVEPRRGSRRDDRAVSVVGGLPVPSVIRLVEGFARGARAARPEITVQVSYSGDFVDQSICERIANRQIDRGSDVVFAAAGTCGLGALSAAGIRGVWGIGADADRSYLGPHILASTVKRYDRAVLLAIRGFVQGTLPAGHDVEMGLDDEAVGITGISADVPAAIRKKLAGVAAALRAREHQTA